MINTIMKCISVGTSVATVVLAILNKISTKDAVILLGLGLFCLSILNLRKCD